MINTNTKIAILAPLLIAAAHSPTVAAQAGVIESDQFFIQIIKDFDYVWDDRGSGAKRDVTILRPKAPAGFYTLGHVAVPRYQIEGRRTPFTIVINVLPPGSWTRWNVRQPSRSTTWDGRANCLRRSA